MKYPTPTEGDSEIKVCTSETVSCTDCYRIIETGQVYTRVVRRMYPGDAKRLVIANVCNKCKPARAENAENL